MLVVGAVAWTVGKDSRLSIAFVQSAIEGQEAPDEPTLAVGNEEIPGEAYEEVKMSLGNAVEVGRDAIKLESLREQQQRAEELVAISTRYNDLLDSINEAIASREASEDQYLDLYVTGVAGLSQYDTGSLDQVFAALKSDGASTYSQGAMDLMREHVEQYRADNYANRDGWRADIAANLNDTSAMY